MYYTYTHMRHRSSSSSGISVDLRSLFSCGRGVLFSAAAYAERERERKEVRRRGRKEKSRGELLKGLALSRPSHRRHRCIYSIFGSFMLGLAGKVYTYKPVLLLARTYTPALTCRLFLPMGIHTHTRGVCSMT